jgi:hypothetical protein
MIGVSVEAQEASAFYNRIPGEEDAILDQNIQFWTLFSTAVSRMHG